MIKKQLGLLAGSVMMAAGSDAAITLGGDTLVVFNTAGAGSYYQLVGGSTGDSLVEGESFDVDVLKLVTRYVFESLNVEFGPNIHKCTKCKVTNTNTHYDYVCCVES